MFALMFLGLAVLGLVTALLFISLPQVESFKSTPERDSIAYKAGFWAFMMTLLCIVGWIVCAALGR